MKKSKLRNLVFPLLVTLPMMGLAGCGSKTTEETQEVVNIMPEDVKATISVQAEKNWIPYYEDAANRVKEVYPNATINIKELGSFDTFNIIDSTDINNPDVPDVFSLPVDRLYGLAQNEVLANFDTKAIADEVGGFENFEEGFGGAFKIDDEYLAMPFNIETLIAFGNKANAEKKGVDLTQSVEFTELSPEDMLSIVHDCWFGTAFANTTDLTMLDFDENEILYSDLTKNFSELTPEQQKLFEALFDYWKAHDEKGTDLWDKDAAGGYIDSSFTTGGETFLRIDGPWATPNLSKLTNDGADLEVLSISNITLNGKALTHWQSGWGLGINARLEEKPEEMLVAMEMIKQLINPEYATDLFETTGKILPNVDIAIYESSDLPEISKKVIKATLESYDTAVSRPLFIEFGQVWGAWQNALLSWAATQPETAEEAYEQVQASFQAMMANFGQ